MKAESHFAYSKFLEEGTTSKKAMLLIISTIGKGNPNVTKNA